MKILEKKSQKIIIKEGLEEEFLLPIISGPNTSEDKSLDIEMELMENSSIKLYILGVLNSGSNKIQFNSINAGVKSSLELKFGVIQFGTSVVDFRSLMKVNKGSLESVVDLYAESLLLSSEAKADLTPSIEISENDVTAAHGAVVRSLDPTQIFYLRTRGIPLDIANEILVMGFFNSFDAILPKVIKDEFNCFIENELSKRYCPLNCEWCK